MPGTSDDMNDTMVIWLKRESRQAVECRVGDAGVVIQRAARRLRGLKIAAWLSDRGLRDQALAFGFEGDGYFSGGCN